MQVKNFGETASRLQPYLVEYLQSRGLNTNKNFECINPTHNDSHPSMSVVKPENKRVYCHSCGFSGDIFDCVHALEDKPLVGTAFVTETLEYLGEKFGIEVEHEELTEEQIYELDTYRAYKYAAEFVTSWKEPTEQIAAEFNKRNWTEAQWPELRSLGVGFIGDFKEFREHLKGRGFSASFLDDIDLGAKTIFADGNLIYTIKDEFNRPVGFAARNLSDTGSKFVNQRTTGVKCNIYQKGKRLYNFAQALKYRSEGPLYIMEGYSDVLTSTLNGFNRAVAICGTALTNEHILLLKEHGIFNVVLCLDGDEPGQEKTQKIIDEKFALHKDISIKVVVVPDEQDPDEYIREHSIRDFEGLTKWSAFEWRLNRFEEEEDIQVIANTMMPLIVSEPSRISQEVMLNDLARYTGITLRTLQEELSRLVNEKDKNKDRERTAILDRMRSDMAKNPDDVEIILAEAQGKLYSLRSKYDEDKFSEDATLKNILDYKSYEESKSGDYQGFVLGPDLKELQDALTGEWDKDVFLVFGGKANVGKSSFMCKLSYEIARHIENDACVIYHSIDDSAEQLLPKVITIAEGSKRLEINHVKNPNYYKGQYGIDFQDLLARRESGYETVIRLIREGRFVIKDSNDGSSLGYAEALIKYYQDKYPERKIVYVLDNFHKLRDFDSLTDERTRFKTMSTIVKNIATKYHVPVISTMEYTKLPSGVKPTNNNIAESVQMEYDANLIAHMYNALHDLGDKVDPADVHVVERGGDTHTLPIIEMNIGKNKISSFKSKLYFRFFPAAADFVEQPIEVQQALMNQSQEESEDDSKITPIFSRG